MELERLSVTLRPRNTWEAIDLGVRFAMHHARPLYAAWFAVVLPVALLLHFEPLANVHAQVAADRLQREPQLFLNFRIAGDRLLRFARERHPNAGDVDHERYRSLRHRAPRLR